MPAFPVFREVAGWATRARGRNRAHTPFGVPPSGGTVQKRAPDRLKAELRTESPPCFWCECPVAPLARHENVMCLRRRPEMALLGQ